MNLGQLAAGDADGMEEAARALVQKGAEPTGPLTPEEDEATRHVFKVLHGWYGNLFLSRYCIGIVIPKGKPGAGEDEGMVNARRMWAFALRRFSGSVLKEALTFTRSAHPEFPPTLPQFEAICKARAPRGAAVAYDANGPLLLSMDKTLVSRYARQAREINARHASRALASRQGFKPVAPTLDGLKQAIADAVGAAGGDEVATLQRLDREIGRKASHG